MTLASGACLGRIFRHRTVLASSTLCLAGLLLFGGAVQNGFTTWDDDLYVLQNPMIRDASLAGVARIFTTCSICNYHPLTLLTFLAEHAAVGFEPWLYHLDNVLLHIAATVLAFLLARKWLESEGAALAAALLFLAHPLRVESVAWVAERKDVLCAAFYLASLLAYTFHLDHASGAGRRGSAAYWASMVFFVLALLSKVMAVTLPGVLVLLLVWKRQANRRHIAGLAPLVALSVVFALIGAHAQAAGGAIQGLHGGGLGLHLLTVLKALALYAEKLACPVVLSPRYTLEPAASLLEPRVLEGAALVAIGIVTAAVSLRRGRTAFLGIVFFAITWSPVSGIVPLSTIVADRYVYLPALGVFLVVGGLLRLDERRGRSLVVLVLGVFVAACLVLTPARVAAWRDGETLWTDALRENPRNPFAFNQLSVAYLGCGRYAEALSAAEDAARFGLRRPEHLFNLCLAYRGLDDRENEEAAARGILASAPDFIPAWLVVLRQLTEDGKLDACAQLLDRLAAKHPEDPGLLGAAGRLEEARGNLEGALLGFLRSIELRPGDPETLLGAAVILARLGDVQRAVETAEGASRIPGGVLPPGARKRLTELAIVAQETGRPDLAERVRALEHPGRRP